MKVLVTDNAHLYKTPDGKYYTPSIYGYEFFQRYLNTFDEVRFVSKTKYVDNIDDTKYLLVSGEKLEIFELPWYQGMKEMMRNIFKLISRYHKACDGCDCYIFRIAQIESFLTYIFANKRNKPFAVEIVNDPINLFSDNFIYKKISVTMMKAMLKKANGASYITSEILQKQYPSNARKFRDNDAYFESYYATIDLNAEDFLLPKKYTEHLKHLTIVHVSNTISDEKKGHRTVINIIYELLNRGYSINAKFIGDGPALSMFQDYARELGVINNIEFVGRLHTKKALLMEISKCDLFVFPSHSEGMGRVNIEAMAAGLPCLASNVGGIVELFDEKYLFDPLDVEGFVKSIIRLLHNPKEMEEMSEKNINNAKKFSKENLTIKRNEFYKKLRVIAENKQSCN